MAQTQRRDAETKAPRIPARAPAAERRDARLLSIEQEGSFDTLRFEGQRMEVDERLDATLASFLDCAFEGLSLGTFACDHAQLTGTDMDACGMVRLSMVGASVFSSGFASSRFGSMDAMESVLRSVEFQGCRIGYLNLRAAQWRDVVFRDCRIDQFDAADATLARVAFPGTAIGSLSLRHASLADVDLRGAKLEEIQGVEYLHGVTMTLDQIADLAPAFAASIGIRLR